MEEITPRDWQRYSTCLGSSLEEVSIPAAHLYPNINQLPHPPLELAFSILKDDTQSDYSELVSFVEQGFAILFQKQTSKDLL